MDIQSNHRNPTGRKSNFGYDAKDIYIDSYTHFASSGYFPDTHNFHVTSFILATLLASKRKVLPALFTYSVAMHLLQILHSVYAFFA